MNKSLDLSVVIIAHREHQRIGPTLDAVRQWAGEIIVVVQTDDDPTIAVARERGAQVFINAWPGFAAQKNFALGKARYGWTLQIDADEVASPALARAIIRFVRQDDQRYTAASFDLRDVFLGRRLRFGESRRELIGRLVRRGHSQWHGGLIHEHQQISGKAASLPGTLLHYSNPDSVSMLRKHSDYADLFVAQSVANGRAASGLPDILFRPVFRFLRGYLLRLGLLDGYPGYLYARHMAVYTFMRYARLREYTINPSYRARIDLLLEQSGTVGRARRHGADRLLAKFRRGRA